jgi:hypothetical protein
MYVHALVCSFVSLSFCHSIYLRTSIFVYLTLCLFFCKSVNLFVHLSFFFVILSVFMNFSICLSDYSSVCLSTRLVICLSVFAYVRNSLCPSVCLSSLSIYPSLQPIRLSVLNYTIVCQCVYVSCVNTNILTIALKTLIKRR